MKKLGGLFLFFNKKNTNEINDLKKQLREQEEQNTNEINKINNLISNEIEGIKEKYLKQEKFDKEIKKNQRIDFKPRKRNRKHRRELF